MRLTPLLLAPAVAALSGCVVDVPVSLSLPAAVVDLDAARVDFEARVCADVGTADCAVLDALDRVDGVAATPTELPLLLPAAVDVERFKSRVDVARWFELQQAAGEELSPARRIALTLPDAVSADAVAGLAVDAVAVRFVDSTLTVAVPDFDLYVGNGDDDDGEFVGVDEDDVVSFKDGGVDALQRVLLDADAWLELRPQTLPTLTPERDGFLRPGGTANVVVDLSVSFPVQLGARVTTGEE